MKFSITELELLAVVWSIEHFKNYVYGKTFGVVFDHKALQSVLSANKGNKTFSSRLTRWADRFLPYDLNVVHTPGRTLGIMMTDYLSRQCSRCNGGTSIKSEELITRLVHHKCSGRNYKLFGTYNFLRIETDQSMPEKAAAKRGIHVGSY